MASAILAGCGGSSASEPQQEWQAVRGPGFTFDAPAGWKVGRADSRVWASQEAELVQVATFPLLRRYKPTLFGKVAPELRTRVLQIAGQTNGRLSGERTVNAGGIRAHAYDVTIGDQVDEYTFVLAGKREYQLLCRRSSDKKSEACERLATSFSRA